jgi:hypothetical protein
MNAVLRLIEKQAAMRRIHDRLEAPQDAPGRFVKDGVAYGPCLLISRECAGGGSQLARAAGEQLGWSVFDGELVDEIARLSHERQRLIESVDERFVSVWEHSWQDVLLKTGAMDVKYLHGLRQVVLSLGHHGSVIIVGRGAQHLLPPECALRVRLVAPLEWRVHNAAKQEGLSAEAALAKIKATDAARAAFIWKTFHARADDALNYDLTINTGDTGIEGATQIVLAAMATKLGVRAGKKPHGAV